MPVFVFGRPRHFLASKPYADELEDVRIPPGVGVAGWVVKNEQYLLVPDTTKDSRFYSEIDTITGMKTKSLFVDDEAMLVDVAKNSLGSLGYLVTIETDSTEALTLFKQSPDKYDIVVTDMTMPILAGDKMAREMMDVRPDIPVIICTGFNTHLSKETAMSKGFKGFLMKPVAFNDLALAVRKVLDDSSNLFSLIP